jgi:Arc/MetJ-type ribon-helix-helix transcriptional regulator
MPHSVRVSDPLWDKAIAKSKRTGESVSDVVRMALEKWTEDESDADVTSEA